MMFNESLLLHQIHSFVLKNDEVEKYRDGFLSLMSSPHLRDTHRLHDKEHIMKWIMLIFVPKTF